MRRYLPKLFTALAARWRVALLVCVTTLVFVWYYGLWTLASWSLPTNYGGDSLEILARIQAAAEGDTIPLRPQVISRLGAPYGANWSAYPSSDLLLLWAFGQLARLIGVFAAANVALLTAVVSSALAFYACARWLRVRWEWAFAAALLFSFTFQTFHRGQAHLLIVYSWTVPLALLTCGLIAASRRIKLRSRTGVFCLATAAMIGISNPYTLFMFLQLVGWAMIAQWFGRRRTENLVTGAATLGAAFVGFLVVEAHLWLFVPDTAAASPIVRNYFGTELYALKPLELIMPPAGHRWDALAFFGQRYMRWSAWRIGENFSAYLGLIGIGGFVWLIVMAVRSVFRRDRLPGHVLPAVWILGFASVGGSANVIAFFTGLNVFRATNRYSIFISAIVLLFLATRLSRFWRGRPLWASVALAALVAGIGLADQLPRRPTAAIHEQIARRVASDRQLGAELERELPGGMVFQLPLLGFPEAVGPHQLNDYEHFRAYLGSRTLRFTYGSLKGRSRGQWQRDTAALPVADMVRRLEEYGFSAIYINRRGFADRGKALLAELAELGYVRKFRGRSGDQVVVPINPSPNPVVPVAHTLTFGRGWYERREGRPRWAFGPVTMSYFNPFDKPVEGRIRFVMSAVKPRHVRIHVNGVEQLEVDLDQTRREVPLWLTFAPGYNRLDLKPVEPPVRLNTDHEQLRTFAVHETEVQVKPDSARGARRRAKDASK